MSQPIFHEGQEVGCLMFGEGVVSSVRDEVISVDFAVNRYYFLQNGALTRNYRPTLYPIDQYREIIANLPAAQPEAWKPKPGDWCWFWDDRKYSILDKFKEMNENLYRNISGYSYLNCAPFTGELPPHLKEVQP